MSKGVAVIYCRVSTDNQEDNTSLETQEEDGRAYCAERGYGVAAVFKDTHSGYDMDRKGLRAALDAIRQGTADVLVVRKLDRLSRKQTHQAMLFYQIEEDCKARVESVLEQLDNSPIGQFARAAAGLVAEMERENTKERMGRGKRARAERGSIIPGSFPLYGYAWGDERHTAFVPDEETAPIVRRMFREIAEGGKLLLLANDLTDKGIPTPSQYWSSKGMFPAGRKVTTRWAISTIHQILQNPAYKGEHAAYRWNHKKGGDGVLKKNAGVRAVNDPARIPLPASACPPLVDTATWEAVQRQFERNRNQASRNTKRPDLALLARGYVFCGHCGYAMGTRYHHKYDLAYYRCVRQPSLRAIYEEVCEYHPHIAARELDTGVMNFVSILLQHPESVRRAVESYHAREQEGQTELRERIDTLDKLIEQHRARQARLLRKLEELDDDVDIAPRIKELGQQIKQFQAERDTLVRAITAQSERIPIEELVLSAAQDAPAASYEYKRSVLHALGVKVVVWAEGHAPNGGKARWGLAFAWDGINESALLPQHS